MSIVTSSLYNKLPSISPAAIANATASTASATGNFSKDAFFNTIGKLPEYGSQTVRNTVATSRIHPIPSVLMILGLVATGLIFNARRQAAQAAKKIGSGPIRDFAYPKSSSKPWPTALQTSDPNIEIRHKGTTGISSHTAAHTVAEKSGVQETHKITPATKVKPKKTSVPPYISDCFYDQGNWKKLNTTLINDPKSIEYMSVIHFKHSDNTNIFVRPRGYDPENPRVAGKELYSFDIVPQALSKDGISLEKIHSYNRQEISRIVGTPIPEYIPIYFRPVGDYTSRNL